MVFVSVENKNRDGFCLICLLLQKRIYRSSKWKFIVDELRCQSDLASEGAVIFTQIINDRNENDRKREQKTVDKITENLNRIKEQQKNLNETKTQAAGILTESTDHYQSFISFRQRLLFSNCFV